MNIKDRAEMLSGIARQSSSSVQNRDNNIVTLYHGTGDKDFKPNFNYPNYNNDYGRGLYTSPVLELAKEWAMYRGSHKVGTVVEFEVDLEGLNILDLRNMDSLYWVSILANNRKIDDLSEVAIDNLERLSSKYYIDVNNYDLIIGYRADDSYYMYMKSFISGELYRDTFEKALRLGNLGIQYCIKSELAFSRLIEKRRHETYEEDRLKYIKRDKHARARYIELKRNGTLVKKSIHHILMEEGL